MGLVLKPRVGLLPRWNNNPVGILPPVVAWMMNEGNGAKVYDLSGNNKNGDLIATSTWVSTEKGQGVQFDGNSDYIQVANGHELIRFSHEIIYIPIDITTRPICQVVESPGNAVHDREFYIGASSKYSFRIWDGAAKLAASTTLAVAGVPVHLVGTSDGLNIKIYVNGVLEATTAAGDAYTGYTTPEFVIGYGWDGSSNTGYSGGTVVLARIYDHALASSQVAYLYQYPYYAWEYPELWEYYAAAAVGATMAGHYYRTLMQGTGY